MDSNRKIGLHEKNSDIAWGSPAAVRARQERKSIVTAAAAGLSVLMLGLLLVILPMAFADNTVKISTADQLKTFLTGTDADKANGQITDDIAMTEVIALDTTVAKTLEIPAGLTITAASNTQAFIIPSGGNLTLKGYGTLQGKGNVSGSAISGEGSLTLKNATITGFNAASAVNMGSFAMESGSIAGNTVTGGAVHVASGATFTLTGGSIKGNACSGNGGGVYAEGTANLLGGAITNNSATGLGAGVYAAASNAVLVGGNVIISDNVDKASKGNVYLPNGVLLGFGSSALTDGATIGVLTENAPDASTPVSVTGNNGGSVLRFLVTDRANTYFNEDANHAITSNKTTLTVTVSSGTRVYTGQQITLSSGEVDVKKGGEAVPSGQYNLTFCGNVSAGTAQAVVVCKSGGKYSGDGGMAVFQISPATMQVETEGGSKEYDGTALTASGAIKGGLVNGETAELVTTGSITNAGSQANNFYIKWGTARESNYTVNSTEGKLTVNKRSIIVQSATDSKEYDGKPLTNSSVTQTSSSHGFIGNDGLDYTVTGTQTEVGQSFNTFEYTAKEGTDLKNYDITPISGTLTVIKINGLSVSAPDVNKYYNGKPHSSTATTSVSGTTIEEGTSTIYYKIGNGDWTTTVPERTDVCSLTVYIKAENPHFKTAEAEYTLKVNPLEITISTSGAERAYDGTPLMAGGSLDGLLTGEEVTFEVTGSQTNVGESDNTYKLTWNKSAKEMNYTVKKEQLGKLKITASDALKIDGTPYEDIYDGASHGEAAVATTKDDIPQTSGSYTTTITYSTDGGQTWSATVPQVKDVETVNVKAKAENYNFKTATCEYTLKVNPRTVTLTSATASKVYDGTPLTAKTVTVTAGNGFVQGEGYAADVTGSQTYVGTSKNTYTYTLNQGTLEKNYTITKVEGDLTVTPIETPIVIKADSDTKKYDGDALTKNTYTYTDKVLIAGDVLTAVVTGSQTDVGSSANKVTSYKVMCGEVDVTNCYTFGTSVDGTLTVTKRNVTLTSATDSKVYDGTPLTNHTVTVSGDGFVKDEGYAATVTGSQTLVGSSTNTFGYTLNTGTKENNYNITKVEGTLTVTPIETELVITADSAKEMYDGEALTKSTYTYTKDVLVEGDTLTAVVEGSQTDVGTSSNVVKSHAIMRGTVDVTSCYTGVKYANGELEVTPRAVTLTSATDEKVYDGTPLTNHNVAVTGDGFVTGEGYAADVTGSQTYVGTSKNTYTYTLNEGTLEKNYTITKVEGDLTVKPIATEIIITAASDTKKYDGEALTNANYTYTQGVLIAGDVLTAVVAGSQTDVGSSANVVESYKVMHDTVEVTNCYTFGTSVNGTLSVTPRSVTLTSATDEKVYDGKALTNDTITVTGDGFVTGEGYTANVTGSQTNVGNADNAFTYTLKQGTLAKNYTIETAQGKLTVTPAAAVVTAEPKTKVYGSNDPDLTAKVTGLVNNEPASTISYTISRAVGEDVTEAGYAITPAGDATQGNYTVTYVADKLTITPAPLSVTTPSDTKVYDGKALTKSEGKGVQGMKYQDSVTLTTTGTITNVGSTSNTYTITWDNAKQTNYQTPTENLGTLTVTPAAAVVTADPQTKVYGSNDPTLTAKVTGLVNDEPASTISYTISRADGEDVTAAGYAITPAGNAAQGNYTVTFVADKLTITPAPLTVVTPDGTQMYNGAAFMKSDGASLKGFKFSDTATLNVTGSVTNVDTVDNTYTITWDNAKQANYEVTSETIGKLSVTPRSVTLTSATDEKVYDGTPLTNDTITVTGDGFVSGEGYTADVTGTQTFVGSSDNTFTYTLNQGTLAKNYTVTKVLGTLTVTPITKQLVITADSDSQKYNGQALTKNTYTYSPDVLAVGDTLTAVVEGSQTNVGSSANVVKSHKIMHGQIDVTDHYTNVSYDDGSLEVTKRTVELTSGTKSKVYDGTPLTYNSVTVTDGDGFVQGEGYTPTVTGSQTFVGTSKNTFTYTLNQGTDAGNYTITTVEGDLTVTPIETPIVITAASDTKVYDSKALTNAGYTYTQGVLVAGDTLTAVVEGSQTIVGNSANVVTSHKIMHGTVDVTDHYTNVSYVDGTLTVTPAPVVVQADDKTKVYGDADPALTATVTGLVDGESKSLISYTLERVDGEDVVEGGYVIVARGLASQGNYSVEFKNGILNITPAPVTIVTPYAAKVYDGKPLTKEGKISGLKNGETVSFETTGTITNVGSVENSFEFAWDGTAKKSNYTVQETVGILTITPAPVTVTADEQTKKKGDPDPELTAKVTGLLDDDTIEYKVTREPGENAGKYPITPAGEEYQGNYVITYVPAQLTITEDVPVTGDNAPIAGIAGMMAAAAGAAGAAFALYRRRRA